jgi:GH18 family chitinase
MMKSKILCSLLIILLASCNSGDKRITGTESNSSSVSNSPDISNFISLGYFPSWQGDPTNIQFDKLTHIVYSFLLPNEDGSFQPIDNEEKLIQLVTMAKANNVKVMIAIGGWNDGDDSAFEILASNSESRDVFVKQVMAFVTHYDLDGVDMDWEYPDKGQSAENYATLMAQLSSALHQEDKLLSAAVVALGSSAEGVLDLVFEYVDFLNLMIYDGSGEHHSSYKFAIESLDYWQGRGLAKEKTVLGVPFYAKPNWETYRSLVDADPSYACQDSLEANSYNGIPTIRKKTKLALERAGGIMNWELSQDSNTESSLVTAIWEVIKDLPSSYQCPI